MLPSVYHVALFLGPISHLLFFIRGEWHLLAPRMFWLSISSTLVAVFLNLYGTSNPVKVALYEILLPVFIYGSATFLSIVTYRAFFHRLHNFPGPFLAKISKLWHVLHCTDSKNYLLLEKLHQKHGAFIRTGQCATT